MAGGALIASSWLEHLHGSAREVFTFEFARVPRFDFNTGGGGLLCIALQRPVVNIVLHDWTDLLTTQLEPCCPLADLEVV